VAWRNTSDPDLDLDETRKGSQRLVLDTRKARRLSWRKARKKFKEERENGIFVGHDALGWPQYSMAEGGVLLVGGARSGKLRNLQTTALSQYTQDVLLIDPKMGENAYQLKKLDRRHVVMFMTQELPGLGRTASANIWGHLVWTIDGKPNPDIVGWIRIAAADFLGYSGDAKAKFFEVGGRERFLTPVMVQCAQQGDISVPRVAGLFQAFLANSPEWAGFEYDMTSNELPFVCAMAAKFKKFRTEGFGHGGEEGMLSEVLNAFVCMNDERNARMVSPPYSFDFEWLSKTPDPSDPNDWPYTVVMAMPKEQIVTADDAPLVRGFISAVMHHKRKAPLARQLMMMCEEAGNLAPFPGLVHAFTEVVLQSPEQGDELTKNGFSIMSNSSSAHIVVGIRDIKVAERYAERFGNYQVEYVDEGRVAEARLKRRQAKRAARSGDGEALQIAREMRIVEQQLVKETRPLRDKAELINNTPKNTGYGWFDEIPGAVKQRHKPWWEILPIGAVNDNPPYWRTNGENRVIVPHWLKGTSTREMINFDEVPEQYQDAFQFRHGNMPARGVKGVKY